MSGGSGAVIDRASADRASSPGPPERPNADLAWVTEILWGVPVDVAAGEHAAAAPENLAAFVAIPSARHPHLLVPFRSREAAARALRSYTDARRRVRAGAAALGTAIRLGLPHWLG